VQSDPGTGLDEVLCGLTSDRAVQQWDGLDGHGTYLVGADGLGAGGGGHGG
jgi:hypothetical protein